MISVISKIFHRWLRQQVISRLDSIRMDSHLGGFRGQQAVFGAQYLQVFARIAHAQQTPAAGLFLDVQGAYHFLIRELVVGKIDPHDEQLVINNLHDWKADTKGVKLWLRTPSILHRLHFPERLITLLREIHVDTWSRVPHLQQLLRSARGSGPGSPLADAIYSILMVDVHAEMYRLLEEHEGLMQTFGELGIHPFVVTWADDVALPIAAPSNHELIEYAGEIMKRVYIAFERRGLLLNMSKGKTSLVPAFRGPDAPSFRTTYLLTAEASLEIDLSLDGQHRAPLRLRFECSYKHLGMLFVPDGEVNHEVCYWLGHAKAALRDLRPVLFGNKHISTATRLRLCESLIISRLCYGISAWGHVAPRLIRQIEAFILRAQRQICGYPLIHGPSNDEMISRYRLPNLSQRLSMARLSYAVRLWSVGPESLRDLLYVDYTTSNTSWWHYLQMDLQWCQELCGDRFPVEDLSIETLEKSWKLHPSVWKRAIKGAYRKAILQEVTAADVRARHTEITKILTSHGAVIEGEIDGGLPQPDAHQCPECPRSFTTIQGLTAHRRFAHGYKAPESQFVTSAVCPQCLRFFWSKARVRQHLAYVPRSGQPNPCFAALQKRGYHPDIAELDPDEKISRTVGINRRDSLRAAGPLPEVVDADLQHIQTLDEALRSAQEEFQYDFGLEKIPLDYVTECSGRLTRATQEWFCSGSFRTLSDEDAIETLQLGWTRTFEDGPRPGDSEVVFVQWGREILPELCQRWEDGLAESHADRAFYELASGCDYMVKETENNTLQRRLRQLQEAYDMKEPDKPHRSVKYGPTYRRGSNKAVWEHPQRYKNHDKWQERIDSLSMPYGPKDKSFPFYRSIAGRAIYLVVHLFSGRRRTLDFHDRLSKLVQLRPYDVNILSLDTAICKTHGNLASSSVTWSRLLVLLEKGAISAGLAGPPCETYSAARYYEPSNEEKQDERQWPRPLRDSASPWGLGGLSSRELRQLSVGSSFALQTLVVLAWLLVQGGSFLIEHPAPPQEAWKVSVFRTKIAMILRMAAEIRFEIFCQGDWGASSTKPRGILALRTPSLRVSMLRWRAPTPRQDRITSIGKNPDGAFKTQHLKEYPVPFSAGLAQCVADTIRRFHRTGAVRQVNLDSHDLKWISDVLAVASVIGPEGKMLPDYQPGM